MGFLDHSTNNIILDAVLTDYGRQALAANDGSFSIFKFAFSDEEVDYGNIPNFGRTVGKEKIEKNTPILEAITQGSLGQKYRCMSINNDALTRLPTLTITETTDFANNVLSMDEGQSKTMTLTQTLGTAGGTLDPDVTDYSYRITMNSLFLRLASSSGTTLTPDQVDSDNIATYVITALPSIGADGRSSCSFQVITKPVTDDLFNTYKQKGGSVVEKIITVSGNNSGAFKSFRVQITSS
jgi:hypothetical protein